MVKPNQDAPPPPAQVRLLPNPPSRSSPAASSTRVRVPRFAVKWGPTEEIVSCDSRWSLEDFVEALEDLTDGGVVAGTGYQYKIGGRGQSEVIPTDEDEHRIFLGRIQKAPKGARVLVRPTSSVRSLHLQFGTLR